MFQLGLFVKMMLFFPESEYAKADYSRENVVSKRVKQERSKMPSPFHVYVELTAIKGFEKELLKSLQHLSRASVATDLCSRFAVSVASDDPSRFHLFETFESKAIYPDHVATAHAQHFLNFVIPNYVDARSVIFLEESMLTT